MAMTETSQTPRDQLNDSDSQNLEAAEPPRPDVDIIDCLLFLLFLPAFLGSLILFELVQRIALSISRDAHERSVLWLSYALNWSLKLIGVRIHVEGLELLPAQRTAFIVLANHQSLFDIPIIHAQLRSHFPRFVAKRELAKYIPSVSFNLTHGGNAIIDRNDPRQALPEIKRLGERMIDQNFAVVIFPEGTRARRGILKAFRPAGVTTLLQTAEDVPIYPIVLDGTWMLSCRKFGPIRRGIQVHVQILPPVNREGLGAKDIVNQVHATIESALKKGPEQLSHDTQEMGV